MNSCNHKACGEHRWFMLSMDPARIKPDYANKITESDPNYQQDILLIVLTFKHFCQLALLTLGYKCIGNREES